MCLSGVRFCARGVFVYQVSSRCFAGEGLLRCCDGYDLACIEVSDAEAERELSPVMLGAS